MQGGKIARVKSKGVPKARSQLAAVIAVRSVQLSRLSILTGISESPKYRALPSSPSAAKKRSPTAICFTRAQSQAAFHGCPKKSSLPSALLSPDCVTYTALKDRASSRRTFFTCA